MIDAEQRARDLLLETELFDELGLHRLAATARTVARDVVNLAAALEAERSARVAIQEARDRCIAIISSAAYDQIKAANVELGGARPEATGAACAT